VVIIVHDLRDALLYPVFFFLGDAPPLPYAPCVEYLPTFAAKNTQMQVNISYIEHMGLLGPETVAVRFSVTGECHAKATAWSLSLRAEAASLAEVFRRRPVVSK